MLPSPHETKEIASRGQSPGCRAAAGSRCSIARARPTACGPWLASVEVTRKSNRGSSPREQWCGRVRDRAAPPLAPRRAAAGARPSCRGGGSEVQPGQSAAAPAPERRAAPHRRDQSCRSRRPRTQRSGSACAGASSPAPHATRAARSQAAACGAPHGTRYAVRTGCTGCTPNPYPKPHGVGLLPVVRRYAVRTARPRLVRVRRTYSAWGPGGKLPRAFGTYGTQEPVRTVRRPRDIRVVSIGRCWSVRRSAALGADLSAASSRAAKRAALATSGSAAVDRRRDSKRPLSMAERHCRQQRGGRKRRMGRQESAPSSGSGEKQTNEHIFGRKEARTSDLRRRTRKGESCFPAGERLSPTSTTFLPGPSQLGAGAAVASSVLHLPQVLAKDLARRALRHRLNELDVCKVLVGGGALRDVRLDLLGAQRGVRRLPHDIGLRQLPGTLVGHADDGGVGHAHVAQQNRLELSGRHLEALDLDQLLNAVDHVVAPLCVDVANVARVQVPIGVDRASSRLGAA
eukprot:scaffold27929_cov62-Phaeocystis_antarctica.AAC.2